MFLWVMDWVIMTRRDRLRLRKRKHPWVFTSCQMVMKILPNWQVTILYSSTKLQHSCHLQLYLERKHKNRTTKNVELFRIFNRLACSRSKYHNRLPIRIGHISHQHLTFFKLVHLIDACQDIHLRVFWAFLEEVISRWLGTGFPQLISKTSNG